MFNSFTEICINVIFAIAGHGQFTEFVRPAFRSSQTHGRDAVINFCHSEPRLSRQFLGRQWWCHVYGNFANQSPVLKHGLGYRAIASQFIQNGTTDSLIGKRGERNTSCRIKLTSA